MYKLGQEFREMYEQFLATEYISENVYTLSSYADRCQMSAQLLLAGLYPPVKEQIWNTNIMWQPIPVHYLQRHLDNVSITFEGDLIVILHNFYILIFCRIIVNFLL